MAPAVKSHSTPQSSLLRSSSQQHSRAHPTDSTHGCRWLDDGQDAEIAYFESDGCLGERRGLCVRDVGSAHGTRVEVARGDESTITETILGGGAAPVGARSPSRWLEIGLGDTIQIGETTLALVRRTTPALAAASKPMSNPQLARALVCKNKQRDRWRYLAVISTQHLQTSRGLQRHLQPELKSPLMSALWALANEIAPEALPPMPSIRVAWANQCRQTFQRQKRIKAWDRDLWFT